MRSLSFFLVIIFFLLLPKVSTCQSEYDSLLIEAEQGHASAQYNLALKYDNGEGVLQDYKEAVKWYTKAAEQGHS